MPFRIATTANGDKSQIDLAGKQVYPSCPWARTVRCIDFERSTVSHRPRQEFPP